MHRYTEPVASFAVGQTQSPGPQAQSGAEDVFRKRQRMQKPWAEEAALDGQSKQGQLAEREGLAHDAGNLLGALGLYCDLMSRPEVLAPAYQHYVAELRHVAVRSRALIERMLTLEWSVTGGASRHPAAAQSGTCGVDVEKVAPSGAQYASRFQPRAGRIPKQAKQAAWRKEQSKAVRWRNGLATVDAAVTLGDLRGLLQRIAGPDVVVETECAVSQSGHAASMQAAAERTAGRGARGCTMNRGTSLNLNSALSSEASSEPSSALISMMSSMMSSEASSEASLAMSSEASPAMSSAMSPFTSIAMCEESLERILVNLTRNAAAAMPGGGRLRITLQEGGAGTFLPGADGTRSTGRVQDVQAGDTVPLPGTTYADTTHADHAHADTTHADTTHADNKPDDHAHAVHDGKLPCTLLLSVQDSGCGMPDERIAHPALPALPAEGSPPRHGLGLRIVRELVQQAGGTLRIASSPGHGTCVAMEFPAFQPVQRSTSPRNGATNRPSMHTANRSANGPGSHVMIGFPSQGTVYRVQPDSGGPAGQALQPSAATGSGDCTAC